MGKFVLALFFVGTLATGPAWCYPGYHMLIPNGDRIPNVCDRSANWFGLGHENPEGGGKLNTFGLHFLQHRRIWTVALCQMDSDGDGMTNGEELGDPDCIWRPTSNYPPRITDQRHLSHPGICEPFDSPRCTGKNGFLLAFCPEKLLLAKKCAAPPPPRHGYIAHYTMSHGADQYTVGDFIQFECDEGYVMSGEAKVYCQQNGTWTRRPFCHFYGTASVSTCPAPRTMPVNSYVADNPQPTETGYYPVGTIFNYECNTGYQASGYGTTSCLQSGDWSPMSLTCTALEELDKDGNFGKMAHNRLHEFPSAAQTLLSCPMPSPLPQGMQPAKGFRTDGRYSPGDVVALTNQDGYSCEGCIYIMCQDTGTFTKVLYKCKSLAPTCPAPMIPNNAQISPLLTTSKPGIDGRYQVGNSVTFVCNPGFNSEPFGNMATAVCQTNGTWATCDLNCTGTAAVVTTTPAPKTCQEPINPPNSQRLLASAVPGPDGRYKIGDVILFACCDPYAPNGNPQITCQSTGIWSQTLFSCQVVTTPAPKMCQAPMDPPNAQRGPNSALPAYNGRYKIGDIIAYTCGNGYDMSGNPRISCQSTGTWSQIQFTCDKQVTCPMPPLPANARILDNSSSFPGTRTVYRPGDGVVFDCLTDYIKSGNPQISCLSSGTWSPVMFTCLQRTCPPPTFPPNACPILEPAKGPVYFPGDMFVIACDFGYVPMGSSGKVTGSGQITCQASGNWTVTDFFCQPILLPSTQPQTMPTTTVTTTFPPIICPSPDMPTYSTTMKSSHSVVVNGDLYVEGDYVQYGCQSGYTIFGTIQCQQDGSWSSASMSCQPISRGILSLNGNNRPGSRSLTGACPPPKVPSNAIPLSSSPVYSAGEFIQYACVQGYTVSGVMTCLRDGTWSASVYVCDQSTTTPPPLPFPTTSIGPTRVTCLAPAVPENSQTVAQFVTENGEMTFPLGAFFIFLCNQGYRMIGDPTIICNTDGRWTESPFCVSNSDYYNSY